MGIYRSGCFCKHAVRHSQTQVEEEAYGQIFDATSSGIILNGSHKSKDR